MSDVDTLDDIDKRLLNMLQTEFPLTRSPFVALGERLGISEEEAIRRTRRLKEQAIIRQISAIFDTRRLGYQSVLVAMALPEENLEKAAAVVGAHPGVSHNYARPNRFNLWFTLALPPGEALEATVGRLARDAHAESFHILPALRTFKIGVTFDMVEDAAGAAPEAAVRPTDSEDNDMPLPAQERAAVRELQEDMTITARPFQPLAQRLGVTEEQLLAQAKAFIERGVMRRFAAVLRHRRAGFGANAMTCWIVPTEAAEETGLVMASFRAVTHCYQRPTFSDWPYSLFTMIHGRSRDDCQQVVDAIAEQTGIRDYIVLYSTQEFKKERVRYFAEG